MRLQFDARTRRLFRRLPVVSVYSLAELLLLGGLAIQSARLVWAVVTPVSPIGDWAPAQPSVPGDPRAILAGFDPFFRLEANQAASTVTSLQLQLFGTRIDEAAGRGAAIIAGPDGVQKSYSVGDAVAAGVTLKSVAFDHVTLDRGGAAEDLFIDQSKSVAPVATASVASGPPLIGLPAAPPPAGGAVPVAQLRQDIGFIPRIDDGRLSGLVVRSQGSGAAFRAAGLRDGDVVTAIGGRPVTGQGDLDRIQQDFAGGGNVPITVERGGQTLALAIPVLPQGAAR